MKKTKVLALLLAIAMIICALPITSLTSLADDTTMAATDFLSGTTSHWCNETGSVVWNLSADGKTLTIGLSDKASLVQPYKNIVDRLVTITWPAAYTETIKKATDADLLSNASTVTSLTEAQRATVENLVIRQGIRLIDSEMFRGDYLNVTGRELKTVTRPVLNDKTESTRVIRAYEATGVVVGGFTHLQTVNYKYQTYENGQTQEIGDRAFKNCKQLKTFNFPANNVLSMVRIGAEAFRGDTDLTAINVPDFFSGNAVTAADRNTIGEFAFADCINLKSIKIGKNISDVYSTEDNSITKYALGYGILENTERLEEMTLPTMNRFKYIFGDRYVSSKLNKVVYTGGEVLYADMFYGVGSTNLTYAKDENGNFIEDVAFDNRNLFDNSTGPILTNWIKTLVLPGTLKRIEFRGSWNRVQCEDGYFVPTAADLDISKLREYYGYSDENGNKSLDVACGLTGMTGLRSISIKSGDADVKSAGSFEVTTNTIVYRPAATTVNGQTAYKHILFGDAVNGGTSVEKAIQNDIDKVALAPFTAVAGIKTSVIPADVKVIGYAAFRDIYSDAKYTLPEGCTAIRDYAFANTDCKVVLPMSINFIDHNALGDAKVFYVGTYEDAQKNIVFHGEDMDGWSFSYAAGKNSANTFPDVPANAWFFEAVAFNKAQGWFNGYANGNFGPGNAILRRDFVLAFANFCGADLDLYNGEDVACKFSDVKADDYYAKALAWAVEKGYVSGYADGKFGAADPINREQVMTILYKAFYDDMELSGAIKELNELKTIYTDIDKVSSWAVKSTVWCLNAGIISGKDGKFVAPKDNTNRAEVAMMFFNF